MKTMLMAVFGPFLLCALASAASVRDHSAPAKADLKKDDDEAPTLETLRIKFEIENFNYFDLTKETCPEKIQPKKHHHKKHHKKAKKSEDKKGMEPGVTIAPPLAMPKVPKEMPADAPLPASNNQHSSKLPWMRKGAQKPPPPAPAPPPPNVDAKPAIDEVHANSDHIANEVAKGLGGFGKNAAKPPWMQKKAKEAEAKGATSFLQISERVGACVARKDMGETKSKECTTVMDVLRDAIKETVQGIIRCLYMESINPPSAPGPAPAGAAGSPAAVPPPPAKAFLDVSKPGPAPAPAPGVPPMPEVRIFVTFTPGRKIGSGRSTMVEITFLDTAGNGVDDVHSAKPFLVWCMNNGMFSTQIGDALDQVTSINPDIHATKMDTEKVEQWNIKKCEKHIRSIVDDFTHHYTRRQVPMALYNECTNFMTRMSFSHDYVLDPQDTVRCRRATRKFAQHWNYGKKTEEKDFAEMCHNACEAKYGRNAPTCNVKAGDGLLAAPKL